MSTIQAYAPGRAELLGNHTDYNEGLVLSMALNCGTFLKGEKKPGRNLILHAKDLQESFTTSLDALKPQTEKTWTNYVIGVAARLQEKGVQLGGAEIDISSTLPMGAGLSSSAALEISTALFLKRAYPFEMTSIDLVKVAQWAEHHYSGVKCGLLDQISSLMSKDQHVTFIDCRSYEVKNFAVPEKAVFVMVNSGVKHALVTGEYNERRESCEEAARLLGVPFLRDVSPEQLEAARDKLPGRAYHRARHVVYENDRVQKAVKALQTGDLETMGRLMLASHESSIRDFENSCPELDALVKWASETQGCYGARLSGGGFGGATINLVDRDHTENFVEAIAVKYEATYKIKPLVLVSPPSAGAE